MWPLVPLIDNAYRYASLEKGIRAHQPGGAGTNDEDINFASCHCISQGDRGLEKKIEM